MSVYRKIVFFSLKHGLMSLCTSLFQKSLYELAIADLESFFSSEQEETSVLEFKAGKSSLEDIHKEVAAFLNTEGGLLIIGAPIEVKHPERKNIKICKGALTPSTISDQDTLMRSIASNISPSPTTIKAKTLPIEGGAVYVLEIGQSINPPHQVSNTGIYYIRLERDAKPAPHGLVEALFFRRQKSELRVEPLIIVKPNVLQARITFEFRNDSMLPVDKFGWIMNISGVKACRQVQQNYLCPIVDDATTAHDESTKLLVRNMTRKVEFDIMLRHSIFYLSFSYYSNEQSLERIAVLYDTRQGKSLSFLNTLHPEENKGNSGDVFDEYEKLLQQAMWRVFKHNYTNQVTDPAPVQDISDFQYEFDVELPRSLVVFWLLTNGFSGLIGHFDVIIWPIDEVKRANFNIPRYDNNKTFQIGWIINKPITLVYKDGIANFEWFSVDGNHKSNGYTSFFDLVEELFHMLTLR
jgi:hypothetical protein